MKTEPPKKFFEAEKSHNWTPQKRKKQFLKQNWRDSLSNIKKIWFVIWIWKKKNSKCHWTLHAWRIQIALQIMMMFYSLRNQNCQTNAFSTENFELKVFKKPTPLPRFCFNLSNSREEEKKTSHLQRWFYQYRES